tara:strand:- start:50 stop:334 length:285 start_codon:yes stop_codon:yes gene_type:complete
MSGSRCDAAHALQRSASSDCESANMPTPRTLLPSTRTSGGEADRGVGARLMASWTSGDGTRSESRSAPPNALGESDAPHRSGAPTGMRTSIQSQ